MRNLRVKTLHNTNDGPDAAPLALATSGNLPRLAAVAVPATVVIDNPVADMPEPIRPNLDNIPRSPPPPYEVSSEVIVHKVHCNCIILIINLRSLEKPEE